MPSSIEHLPIIDINGIQYLRIDNSEALDQSPFGQPKPNLVNEAPVRDNSRPKECLASGWTDMTPNELPKPKLTAIEKAVKQHPELVNVHDDSIFGSETALVFFIEHGEAVKFTIHLKVLEDLFAVGSWQVDMSHARREGWVFLNFESPGFRLLLQHLYGKSLGSSHYNYIPCNDQIVDAALAASTFYLESAQAELLAMYNVAGISTCREVIEHAKKVYDSHHLNDELRKFFTKAIMESLCRTARQDMGLSEWGGPPSNLVGLGIFQLYAQRLFSENHTLSYDIKNAMLAHFILSPEENYQDIQDSNLGHYEDHCDESDRAQEDYEDGNEEPSPNEEADWTSAAAEDDEAFEPHERQCETSGDKPILSW